MQIFDKKESLDMEKLLENTIISVVKANAVEIRSVPLRVTNEEVERFPIDEQPFLYASGNWGPGYVSIKNLVGWKSLPRSLAMQLAVKIANKTQKINFVAGNVTGGVVPAWMLSEYLSILYLREVPFCYIRDTRKKGGQKELLTGNNKNPYIDQGMNSVVVEELVNFAQTTCNGAEVARNEGYIVTHACCILFYDNPEAIKSLKKARIEMVYLFTLSDLLEIAEKYQLISLSKINGYRGFLGDPLGWQKQRGLTPVKSGGTK